MEMFLLFILLMYIFRDVFVLREYVLIPVQHLTILTATKLLKLDFNTIKYLEHFLNSSADTQS